MWVKIKLYKTNKWQLSRLKPQEICGTTACIRQKRKSEIEKLSSQENNIEIVKKHNYFEIKKAKTGKFRLCPLVEVRYEDWGKAKTLEEERFWRQSWGKVPCLSYRKVIRLLGRNKRSDARAKISKLIFYLLRWKPFRGFLLSDLWRLTFT